MEKKIITGLMAYGMSGKVFHAPFVEAHPGFTLRAVTERNQKNAATDYPEIISYNTIEDLLADDQIELIIINTPNNTHYDYAKKALQAGKHILVEKPFTATVEEAKEILALAATLNRKVLFYQNRRWDSDFRAVREVIESGKLGKLSEVHFRYDRYRSTIGVKSFKEDPIAAAGLMYDLGPHLLDQALSIFGKPDAFHKILGKNRVNTRVDDYFSIHLSYPNSVNVFVHSNMMVVESLPAFVINGTNGSLHKVRADAQEAQLLAGMKVNDIAYGIEAPGTEGKLYLLDEAGVKTTHNIPALQGSYLPLFESVYQTIVNDIAYPVTEEQVLTQLEILEA
ncbi:Gfo/Idh/MocA family oxidoreductase [Pedobacter sp. PLR]|uniref:Gfo/Idh/MocA family oxidoreductase n=1 Tax=Pedobacter sp. PLR TaxID=2994465 RepID=UPI002246AADE|nr:Gfo/Idh/MocA family oxidoreductase [Pedobacter sp. PLR]MCX2450428.1 Gfo/Idh/MocA family oxidoreductase [Pedobacter sp. PLR]